MYVINCSAVLTKTNKQKNRENEVSKFIQISKNMFQDENMYLPENK